MSRRVIATAAQLNGRTDCLAQARGRILVIQLLWGQPLDVGIDFATVAPDATDVPVPGTHYRIQLAAPDAEQSL